MSTKYSESNPLLTEIREGTSFVRSVATFVVFVFGFVMYSPSVFAIVRSEAPKEKVSARERYENSFEIKLDSLEQALEQLNRRLNTQANAKRIGSQSWFTHLERIFNRDDVVEARIKVFDAWEVLQERHENTLETREEIEKRYTQIKDPKIKTKIVNKVLGNQSKIIKKHAEFKNLVDAISQAEDIKELKKSAYKATKYIANYRAGQPKHIYDAGEMPFGVSSDATRSPYSREDMLHFYLGLDYDPELDHANVPVNPATDYSPTTDVQITQEIQDLANELGNDPKSIYNWVYNNIYYIPSFGSIQGDVQTLHNRQGNAFDIASLLISLLRASNIPARYVYGTVLMPADQINNWVGGVDDIQSARVIMAQGGIPGSAVSYGGRYEKLRFEHVWVEAWGNFGQTGKFQWNPMDAAFKQYNYTEGVDLLAQVGFDAEQFKTTVENAGTINESESWIANVDATQMQAQLSQYQDAIQNYLTSLPEDTTLAQVIGGQTIIEHTADEIPALPYEQYIRTRSFSELPSKLRHYFRVELATQATGLGGALGGGGATLMSYQQSLPQLAGKALALSFRPATAEDEEIVTALFEGVQTIEDIPTELDAGLFNVIGEVTVDGEVVASTDPIAFGTVLATHKGFVDPRFGYRNTTSPITAGDYQAIGIDHQGVTVNQLQEMQAAMESVQNDLEAQNFDNLTKHDLTGRIVQAGVLAYFAMNDSMTKLAAKMNGLVHYRMPSFGTFSTHSQVTSYWGAADQVKLGGMAMDIDWLMANNEGKVNCWQDWVNFNQMTGQMASAYEHVIPEQLLSTEEQPVEFVSTVKALQIANAEGQRIYSIDQENVSHVLPLIEANSQVKNDIQNAVAAGQTAMIHERLIEYQDYVGSGYVLVDPETGTGAYKISGGGNGSVAGGVFGFSLAIFVLQLIDKPNALVLLVLSGVLLASVVVKLIDDIMKNDNSLYNECFATGFLIGLRLGTKRLKNTRIKDLIGDVLILLGFTKLLNVPKLEQCISVRKDGLFGG